MMEEIQTIFAVGAGAVTKLVKCSDPFVTKPEMKRLFRPKYPYEYLRMTDEAKEKQKSEIFEFFAKGAE